MISDDSISSDDFYPAGSPVVSALYLFSSRSVRIDPSSLRYVMYARWSEANDTCPAYQKPGGWAILGILIGAVLKFENYFEVLFGASDKNKFSNFEQIGHQLWPTTNDSRRMGRVQKSGTTLPPEPRIDGQSCTDLFEELWATRPALVVVNFSSEITTGEKSEMWIEAAKPEMFR